MKVTLLDGCICDPGWTGSSCEERCPIGTYGDKCIGECRCKHGICDTTTGQCFCDSGYSGDSCEQLCPYGFYGNSCKYPCTCYDSSCTCHPVTGNCNISYLENYNYDLFQASHCIANDIIEEQHLVEFVPLQKNYYFIGLCISVTIAIISIVCNFLILCYRCQCACSTRPTPLYHRIRADIMDNSEDDSEEIMMNDLSLKMSKTGRA
ncbi:uncharacterized protein LOC102802783 [Saccoglossus kowalevskii]|uniref:Uncharacterized protein LOC102802783 n=1 Tax=Saccoglossus kowalevskii TaxID=10224 RepID=A0ABM0MBG4_SACKO|nr:PREDICTED: uncharacterized protein LOC102802783 [Saccoglossus kowalevskii]